MKRIIALDTLRFFLTIVIVLIHTRTFLLGSKGYFACGSLAVEIFFILSGFLLAKSYKEKIIHKKTLSKQCITYCTNHFIRLWPEYIFAMCISLILLSLFSKTNMQPLLLNIMMMGGLGGVPRILEASWYVSVVFWGGCFLTILWCFNKEKTTLLFFPILLFLCLFCMINEREPFSGPYNIIGLGILSKGMVRGVLGMIVGIYTYLICEKLPVYKKKIQYKYTSKFLLLCEVVSISAIFYILVFQNKFNKSDFNIYLYGAFLIGLFYFHKEKLLKFMSLKLWSPFSKISYMLFLTHRIIQNILAQYIFFEKRWMTYFLSVFVSLAFAFMCQYVFEGLYVKLKKNLLK